MPCTVTATMSFLNNTVVPLTKFQFRRKVVVGQDNVVVVPDPVSATTNASGVLVVDLFPGQYTATYSRPDVGRVSFSFSVPDTASADLDDLIDQNPPVSDLPASVLTFVGSRTFTHTGTATTFTVPLTTLTDGIASAPRDGDLVVAFIGQGSQGNDAVPMPSGWTELARVQGNDTADADLYVIYKTMGATPDTGFDITGGLVDAANTAVILIFVYAGASASAPVFTTASGINSVLCNPSAITPTVSGSVVLSGGVGAHLSALRTFSSSDFDAFLMVGLDSGGIDSTIGVGRFVWTSGAFDPAAFTFNAADSTLASWAALSLAIVPA